MDKRLRELERKLITDPSVMEQYVQEKARLGYREISENCNKTIKLNDYDSFTLDGFNGLVSEQITSTQKEKYHRFGITFETECDHDDYYDGTMILVHLNGYRFETDKELEARKAKEKETKEREKQYRKQERERRKEQQERQDKYERETYQRLKAKFTKEENFNKYMELVGEEAAGKLREYTSSYLKGWFWRKQSKLDGRTAESLIQEGDIETVRKLALKQL